jgi:hypothetical protein
VFNEAKVFFIGDAARGLQYVPFARKTLFAVKKTGLEYASKAFIVDDVEILVKTSPEADRIFIKVPLTSYLSCFLDTYPILPP